MISLRRVEGGQRKSFAHCKMEQLIAFDAAFAKLLCGLSLINIYRYFAYILIALLVKHMIRQHQITT